MKTVTHSLPTEFVRLANANAAFDATSGHPHGETARMVIATIVGRR